MDAINESQSNSSQTISGGTQLQQAFQNVLSPFYNGYDIKNYVDTHGVANTQPLNQINDQFQLNGTLDLSTTGNEILVPNCNLSGNWLQSVNLHTLNQEIGKISDGFYPNTTQLNQIVLPNDNLNMNEFLINNLKLPESDNDASSKLYVDQEIAKIQPTAQQPLNITNTNNPLSNNLQFQSSGFDILTRDLTDLSLDSTVANKKYVNAQIAKIPVYEPSSLNVQNSEYELTGNLSFVDSVYEVLIKPLNQDSLPTSAINNQDVLNKIGDLKNYVDNKSISDFQPALKDLVLNGYNITELPPYVDDIKNQYNACSIKHLNDSLDGLVQVFMQKGLSLTQINEANPQVVDLTLQSELGYQTLLINTFEVDDPKLPPLQNKYCAVNIEAIHRLQVGFLAEQIAPIDFSEVIDFKTRVIENPPTGFFDKRVANMGALTNYLPSAIAASTYLNFNQDNFNTIINPPIDAVSFGHQCIRFVKEDDEIQNPNGWLTSAVNNSQLQNRMLANSSLASISMSNLNTAPIDMNGWPIENCVESLDSKAVTINSQLANYQQIKSLGYISQHVENDMDIQCNNLPITGLPSNLDINRSYCAQWGSVLDKIASIQPTEQKTLDQIANNETTKTQDDWSNNNFKITNVANADLLSPNDVVNVQTLHIITNSFIDTFVAKDTDIEMNNHTLQGLPSILPLSLYQNQAINGGDVYSVLEGIVSTFIDKNTTLDQIKKAVNTLDIDSHQIINVLDADTDSGVPNKLQVETLITNNTNYSLSTLPLINSNDVSMNGWRLTDLLDGSQPNDAVSLQQIQNGYLPIDTVVNQLDCNGNLGLANFRIVSCAEGIDPNDCVTMSQLGQNTQSLNTIQTNYPLTDTLNTWTYDINYGISVCNEYVNTFYSDQNVINRGDIIIRDQSILNQSKLYTDAFIPTSIQTYQAKVETQNQIVKISNLKSGSTLGCSIELEQYNLDNTKSIILDFPVGTINSGSLRLKDSTHYPLLNLQTKAVRKNTFVIAGFVDDQIGNIKWSDLQIPVSNISLNTYIITGSGLALNDNDLMSRIACDQRFAQITQSLSGFSAPTSDLNIGSRKLLNVLTPTSSNDAVNKTYCDSTQKSIIQSNTVGSSISCAGINQINLTANNQNLGYIACAVGQTTNPLLLVCPDKIQMQSALNAFSMTGSKSLEAYPATNSTGLYIGASLDTNPTVNNNQCQIVIGSGQLSFPSLTLASEHRNIGLGQMPIMTISNGTASQSIPTALIISPNTVISDSSFYMYPNAQVANYPIQNIFTKKCGMETDIAPISSSSLEFSTIKQVVAYNNAQSISNLQTKPSASTDMNSYLFTNMATCNSSQLLYSANMQSVLNQIQTNYNQSYFTVNISQTNGVPITVGGASLASLYYTTTSPAIFGSVVLGISSVQLYSQYASEIIINISNITINFQNQYDISASIQSNASTQVQKLNDSRVFVSCCSFLSSSQISLLISQWQNGASAVFVQLAFRKKQY